MTHNFDPARYYKGDALTIARCKRYERLIKELDIINKEHNDKVTLIMNSYYDDLEALRLIANQQPGKKG